MLVSTFELLYKSITPTPGQAPGSSRIILQGYFLTIANTSTRRLDFLIRFNATTPGLNLADTIRIVDVTGGNSFGDLTPVPGDPDQFTQSVRVPAQDTALLILQPDITSTSLPSTVEFRGFVEIEITTRTPGAQSFDVLLTPEHRGTFLPNDFSPGPNANVGKDFDQLIVSLPTATGSSLFQLPSRLIGIKAIVDNPNPLPMLPNRPIPIIPGLQRLEEARSPIAAGTDAADVQDLRATVASLRESMSLMARAIDSLSGEIAGAETFMDPEP